MPYITNFAFCEQAEIEENRPKAINYLQVIEAFSGSFSFSIIYSITGFTAKEDHHGHVVFFDPNGEKLIETEKFFIEGEENQEIEDTNLVTGISMGVEFNDILFEGHGLYKMEVFFDDEKLGEFFIPVLARRGGEEQ